MNSIAHIVNISYNIANTFVCSIKAKTKAKWWNVNTGKGFKVNGLIHFRKLPNSIISIGNNCKCNSKYNSNLIGVDRSCIFSTLQKGAVIKIGNNCGFSGTVIGAFKSITIGNNVRCGANTLITDADWHLDDPRSGEPASVIVENNVWLGEGTKVLKGVSIGENTVIGAGSIVTKSIPANVIAAGNPCRVIKKLIR